MKSPDLEQMIQQVEWDSFNCLNCGKHISKHQQTFNVTKNIIEWACVVNIGASIIGLCDGKPMSGEMFMVTGKYEKSEPGGDD